MAAPLKADLRNSIFDGMFSNIFATLTGGVFLTGFALYLRMNEFMIGLIAAIPFFVTIFQLPISYLIGENGRRKRIALWGAALARMIWLPILIVVMLPVSSDMTRILIILALIFLSHACASVSYVSWLSWISELVPETIRGKFFGTRNMFIGIAGIIALVLFGKGLDTLQGRLWGTLPLGFGLIFVSAVFFGMVSLFFLRRMSDPAPALSEEVQEIAVQRLPLSPLRELNFRRFIIFAFSWNFAVYFCSPFFTLYFLRDLHFSYGFVAALGMASAFADLIGMRVWGMLSDRVKNKAVMQLTSWVAIFLPLAWVTVSKESFILPIVLHIVGGGFWAGMTLCTNNLLLKISPRNNCAVYFSIYNIMAGLGAAISPIVAGYLLHHVSGMTFQVYSITLVPLQGIFIISMLLRFISFRLFKYVDEPDAVPVKLLVRVLRSIRGLNTATGFTSILHPFVTIRRRQDK